MQAFEKSSIHLVKEGREMILLYSPKIFGEEALWKIVFNSIMTVLINRVTK